MARLSSSWLLITAISVALIASNYNYNAILSSTRPDALMMAFGTLFMAVYLDAVMDGLTLRRGVFLGLCAVSSVSSKELIYAMFVLPVLFLIVRAALGKDPAMRPGKPLLRWALITGLVTFGAYALINIVYAPHTWVARMRYWISGEGLDPSIWGSYSAATILRNGLLCTLENLGVGGVVLVAVAVVALLVERPRYTLALSMPASASLLLTIAQIRYTEIRYFIRFPLRCPRWLLLGLDPLRLALKELEAVRFADCPRHLSYANLLWALTPGISSPACAKSSFASRSWPHPKPDLLYLFDIQALPRFQCFSYRGYGLKTRAFQEILDAIGHGPTSYTFRRAQRDLFAMR